MSLRSPVVFRPKPVKPPVSPGRDPVSPGDTPHRLICKKSGCGPEGDVPPLNDVPGSTPGDTNPNPNPGGDTVPGPVGDTPPPPPPPRVDRPANGQELHDNLRGAIVRNDPDVEMPPYTQNSQNLKRDNKRAGKEEARFAVTDSRVKQLWKDQGFPVSDKVWKPAVMDTKSFKFDYREGSPQGDSSDSDLSVDSGSYDKGEPMVENYHDVDSGSIMVKSQLKIEGAGDTIPFSEKTFQMAKEDFGGNLGNVNRIGVTNIINDGWIEKAGIHLQNVDDFKWKAFERGTPEYNDFLYSDNGKWAGHMFTDHHNALNNKDIVRIHSAKETLPDGDIKGYMVLETGAPQ